jgi:hypothetical protein
MYVPAPRSRTQRLDLKRQVRNVLGPQSEGAATTRSTLIAARWMAELVKVATGSLRLSLTDVDGQPVSWADAIRDANRSDVL